MEDGKKPLPKRSFIRHSIFCLPKPNKTLWLFSAKRSKTSNLFWKLNPVASAVQPIRFRAKFVPTVVRLWQSAGLLPRPRRSETTMTEKLANEPADAAANRGAAVKTRRYHKMAEANKAFSHYKF